MNRTCSKCGVPKDLTKEFYAQKGGLLGRMSKCKDCHKAYVKTNRTSRLEQYSRYEKKRTQTRARKANLMRSSRKHRRAHPDRYKARTAVNNALRDGRLKREPCKGCGTTEKVQAHHHDYSKPLDVTWLCFKCHREGEHGQVVVAA